MNSKSSIAALLFATCLAGATLPAAAEDGKIYVGGQMGWAKARQVCSGASNCDPDETGYKAFAGYQISKNFAAEAGLQYFGMFGRNNAGISALAADLLAVASYPVMNELAVYGRAGVYFGSLKSKPLSEDNIGLTYSLGAEYAFSRELGTRVDWQRYSNAGGGAFGFTTDIDVLSVGLVWRPR